MVLIVWYLDLQLPVLIPLGRGVLNTTLCDKVCQFSPSTLVSFIDKTDCHNIIEILLKMVLNTITLILTLYLKFPTFTDILYQTSAGSLYGAQITAKHLPFSSYT